MNLYEKYQTTKLSEMPETDLKTWVLEILFSGAMFGFVESYHFYLQPAWHTPHIPEPMFFFVTAVFVTWAFLRMIYVVGHVWVPPLKHVVTLILKGGKSA